MARRRSGASAFLSSWRAGLVRPSASWRRTAGSVMFLPARNRPAGPRSVCSMASSRCPVSARAQPMLPASSTASSSNSPASRENPLCLPMPNASQMLMLCSLLYCFIHSKV